MNADQFRQLCIDARDRQNLILFKKGIEYTQGADDRGANFKRIAERLGVDPLVIWYVYFQKHVDAIASYVKYGKVQSEEPIEGRFDDCMNYLLLGLLLIHDKNQADLAHIKDIIHKPASEENPADASGKPYQTAEEILRRNTP